MGLINVAFHPPFGACVLCRPYTGAPGDSESLRRMQRAVFVRARLSVRGMQAAVGQGWG